MLFSFIYFLVILLQRNKTNFTLFVCLFLNRRKTTATMRMIFYYASHNNTHTQKPSNKEACLMRIAGSTGAHPHRG